MCIHRMEEGISRETVGAPREIRSCGVTGATVAAHGVAASVSPIRIVDAELSVIEDVERLHSKLHFATLVNRKVF